MMIDKPFELPEHDPDEKMAFPPRPLGSKSIVQRRLAISHRRSGKTGMVAIANAPTPELRELMKAIFQSEQED